MNRSVMKELVERLVESWNAHDPDAVAQCYARDAVSHDITLSGGEPLRGGTRGAGRPVRGEQPRNIPHGRRGAALEGLGDSVGAGGLRGRRRSAGLSPGVNGPREKREPAGEHHPDWNLIAGTTTAGGGLR